MIEPCVENTTANRDRLYPASVRGWVASRRPVCFNGRTCGRKRRTLAHNISFFNQEFRHKSGGVYGYGFASLEGHNCQRPHRLSRYRWEHGTYNHAHTYNIYHQLEVSSCARLSVSHHRFWVLRAGGTYLVGGICFCRHLVVLGTGVLVDRGGSPWYVRYSVSDSVSDQVCASTDAPGRRHIHSNKINSTGKSVGRGESPLPHNCQLSDSFTPSGVKIPCLSTPQ
jgi:hypothetical protein